ncbi:RNA pseudouridine synthase [Leptospira semungkisensis]|uniref:RNA pseudouridine synthase n=1 Tax=Leptospira semungkisensis TaxID=2484985 RepID=A0A4R9FMW6_9LEPT|nr:RNA pseudouridine synthase [Leptospira semungkisensis]TGJ99780.1 RNA pseudouridine synthase [Leptospira semungkisensis]
MMSSKTRWEIPKSPIQKHYEKGFLLVVEKPPGIPSHATFDPNRPNLEDLLRKQEKNPSLRLVHRLDLDTSGLLLACIDPTQNKEADKILSESEKTYICITRGVPSQKEFRVECFLKDGKGRVSSVRSGGKKAITDFKILSSNPEKGISILAAKLLTGRRHQIRFHLSMVGTPILGDETYGESFREKKKHLVPEPNRFLLHSYLLQFKNEFQEEIRIVSKLPSDFESYLHFFSGLRFPE